MAIAFDASAKGTTGLTTLTFSHTCAGSNRILFVNASTQSNLGSITGVTYNGVALTHINDSVASGDNNLASLWYLIAPATGINALVITATGGVSTVTGVSASYTGALQSGVPDASTINSVASGTSLTTSLTTNADNCWTVLAITVDSGLAAGSGSTSRNIQGAVGFFDSNAVKHPAGSTSMAATFGSGGGATVMASFAPFSITFTVSDSITSTETVTSLKKSFFTILETSTLVETVNTLKKSFISIVESITSSDLFTSVINIVMRNQSKSSVTINKSSKSTSSGMVNVAKSTDSISNVPKDNLH